MPPPTSDTPLPDIPGAELPDLSRSELELIKVLWKRRRASVREVHDEIAEEHGWAYSTTKTLMDRMVKKGYLERRDLHGAFVYQPRISRPLGLARRIQEFADRVLEADYGSVVALFARAQSLSPEEIEELERLLEGEEG